MRADPALCFLEKVGMPDEKSLSAEQGVTDGTSDIPERGNIDKEDSAEDKLDGLQKQTASPSDGSDGIFGEKKDDSQAGWLRPRQITLASFLCPHCSTQASGHYLPALQPQGAMQT